MSAQPEPIHAHAMENIRFIRDAMSRATEFHCRPRMRRRPLQSWMKSRRDARTPTPATAG